MQRVGNQTASALTMPAPVGGLNDRDALASMPVTDAVILRNWWPEPSRLVTRAGSQEWVTGLPGQVETLCQYAATDGTYEVFALAGGGLYDVTDPGEAPDPIISGLSSSQWEPVSISTAGGNFLYLFNGLDKPLLYDGADWEQIDDTTTPGITGVDTTFLKQGVVFKSRLFMVQRNSMKVWYLPAASLGGAAEEIDLGSVFQRDGYIVGLYSWTIDAGAGSDDHLVVLSSNGEAAVYAGTDPSNISTWNLVGLFFVGKPIGNRPVTKFGGDLLLLCERGVVTLSAALLTADVDRRSALSDKVQNGVAAAMRDYGINFGWEVTTYPQQNALIVNVPASNGKYQYLMNLITKAWTTFEGWNANTFLDSGFGLLSGGAGDVRLCWVGNNDGDTPIECEVLQAFQDFKSASQVKYFTMVRPYLRSSGSPSILYGLNGDYNPEEVYGSYTYKAPTGMIWGSMVWGDMYWGGGLRNITSWRTTGRTYHSAAVRLKLQGNGAVTEWTNTNFVFKMGGLL